MGTFSRLPVLAEGRVKPMESFARTALRTYLGKGTLGGEMTASRWLATSVFEPARAIGFPVFRVESALVRERLGLEERKPPIFSLLELEKGLGETYGDARTLAEKNEENLTEEDRALLALHENATEYTKVLRSLSLLLPLEVEIPEEFKKQIGKTGEGGPSYLDLKRIAPQLEDAAKKIVRRKGPRMETYTAEESAKVLLAFQIRTVADAAEGNTVFRVIPSPWTEDKEKGEWYAPWAILNQGKGSPETAVLFEKWKKAALAWQSGDEEAWKQQSEELYRETMAASSFSAQPARGWRLELERAYVLFPPFGANMICLGAALLALVGFFLSGGRSLYRGAVILAGTGVFLGVAGLCSRSLVLGRPPVGTLYESVLFASVAAGIIGLVLERQTRRGIGLVMVAVIGLFLGLLATGLRQDGDDMEVLGAVLNTRFWLATHVLCITLGYGWCLLTSLLAHILLLKRIKGEREEEEKLSKVLGILTLFSLLFMTVGTILGGIWADQSWGRFWGWDPKENGALLIILWLVWLVHGRLSARLSQGVWMGGLAYTGVIVAFSWIGVNLLGVGLHAYGFTQGLFAVLMTFTAFETVLIGSLLMAQMQQKKGKDGKGG